MNFLSKGIAAACGKRVYFMKKKRSAWTDQSGFTLIESIMSMLILSLIISILPIIIYMFAAIDRSVEVENDFEWNLFLIQFRQELQKADEWVIYSNRVFLVIKEQAITYESYGDTIRRRVNNLGHEIVLQKIDKVSFSKQNRNLFMAVDFKNALGEEARFLLPEPKVK